MTYLRILLLSCEPLRLLGRGMLAPALRASLRAIATAWLRFVTILPSPPLRRVLRLNSPKTAGILALGLNPRLRRAPAPGAVLTLPSLLLRLSDTVWDGMYTSYHTLIYG